MGGRGEISVERGRRRPYLRAGFALGALSLATIAAANKDNLHILYGWGQGFFDDSEHVAVPEVADCPGEPLEGPENTQDTPVSDPAESSSSAPAPENTFIPELPAAGGPEATITEPPEAALNIHDSRISSRDSKAYDNDWLSMDLLKIPLQAIEYFDDKSISYESPASERIYDFYIFGDTEYEPKLNLQSLPELEQAPFKNPDIYDEEMRPSVECMSRVLFQEKRFAGEVTSIIIPDGPAYLDNGLIKFGSAEKGKSGFTMPVLQFQDYLGRLLPQYSDFMILTTGPGYDPENPIIRNRLVVHELVHREAEIVQDNYQLDTNGEERYAIALDMGAQLSPGFDNIEPLVTYVRE